MGLLSDRDFGHSLLEAPVGFSLLLRPHLLGNKSFINQFPYPFPYCLISVSWNCLQNKILALDSLNQPEKPKLRCHLIARRGMRQEAVSFRLMHGQPE